VGVAVLSARRGGFDDLLDGFVTLAPRLRGVPRARVRGAGPLRQRSSARVRGRSLLVGDAAGYVDALTGEGIAVGVAQARAAVAAVVADDAASYERAWRRATRRHDLLTHGLLTATRHGALRTRIVPAASALPKVFEIAVNQLARPA
jgi:flavin-dependent dehydrogenase